MNQLLLPCEVAALLRRPIRSVYELVKAGSITAIKDGRRLKFRVTDVQKYINEREYRSLTQLTVEYSHSRA